ncbi:MAG: iron ABC transporter permease [Anaerolineales bacterium]|nr:iron ABC transporter permease [Anaerolineales bacterium]
MHPLVRDSALSEVEAKRLNTRILLWFFPLAFLGVFFFYPLIRIFALSLEPSLLLQADTLRVTYYTLRFTLYQAILSTFLTLLLGLPSAYLFARYDFRGKLLLRAVTAVPFMLPTVVVAAGFNALLGPRGWLAVLLLPFSFQFTGTLTAILVAHVFYNTTIVIRIVGTAISRLDPKLEQAARSLGADPRRVWQHVTLPLLRPSIIAASLLVFLFDFTSFGVILLLGGPGLATLEVEIYLQSVKYFNLSLAALLSLIQLLCTLIFSVIYTRVISRSVVQTAPRSAESNLRKPKSLLEKFLIASAIFLLSSFFCLPLLALPLRSITRLEADRGQRGEVQTGLTTDYYSELFINRRGSVFYVPPMQAALNSLLYASATVILALALGFPAASALAKPTRLEKILDPILMLPLGASAVTLGLGFIISYGRLLTNPLLVPLVHTLVALPFVIRTLQPAIASIPEKLRQAAASLGASPFRVWQTVDWQILRRATLSAATFAFTISLGEFGATLLISRPDYPTIPVAIERFLSQPGGLNYGQAMAMATLLMLLTTACILIIEKLRLPGAGEF